MMTVDALEDDALEDGSLNGRGSCDVASPSLESVAILARKRSLIEQGAKPNDKQIALYECAFT